MIHLLEEPYGIDVRIQEIQEALNNALTKIWAGEIDAYGRIYRNERDGEVIPEVYVANEKGYKSAYYNDRSCFFFIDSTNHTGNGLEFSTKLDIVFMLNLNQLHKEDIERVDEKVFMEAIRVLRESFEGVFTIENHIKGIADVLKGFGTSKVKTNDMQPLHVFSVRGLLEYFINDNCE